MAARLDPDNTQPMGQSLHHLVAKAPWSDEVLLQQMRKPGVTHDAEARPVVAWIVGRSHSSILWSGGETGELPNCSESFDSELGFESAGFVSVISV
jgi:hypothetical protein